MAGACSRGNDRWKGVAAKGGRVETRVWGIYRTRKVGLVGQWVGWWADGVVRFGGTSFVEFGLGLPLAYWKP